MRDFGNYPVVLDAIFEPLLAVPDSILPGASGAAALISVLLLRRSVAIGAARFRTVYTRGRIHPLHNGLP